MTQFWYQLLLVLSFLVSVDGQCYFPDGKTIAEQDSPCYSEGFSTCCGEGYACLSNNLCKFTDYADYDGKGNSEWARGSCTDPNWRSPYCPKFCTNIENGDILSSGEWVERCQSPLSDRYYCLNDQITESSLSNSDVCSNSEYYFEADSAPFTVTIIGISIVTPTIISSTTMTSMVESSTVPTTISSPSLNSSMSPSPSTPSSPSKDKDYTLAIAAGVGVPLGIIAISVVAYCLWRYRRYKREQFKATDTANSDALYSSSELECHPPVPSVSNHTSPPFSSPIFSSRSTRIYRDACQSL